MISHSAIGVPAFAAGSNRRTHVQEVAHHAAIVSSALGLVGRLLADAARLHDIGYASSLRRTGFHPLDGAAHLSALGRPGLIVSLVAYHSGAEYEAEERGLEVELARFDRPPQELLDALILCDMTVGPAGERMTVEQRIAEILVRYASDHPVHRAVTRSQWYLRECAERAARATGSPEEWGFTAA